NYTSGAQGGYMQFLAVKGGTTTNSNLAMFGCDQKYYIGTYGVTAGLPVGGQDFTLGHVGKVFQVEGTRPSENASSDAHWADSGLHRLRMNNNNTGPLTIVGISSAGTSGHCPQFASNGIDITDSGATCSGAGNLTGPITSVGLATSVNPTGVVAQK